MFGKKFDPKNTKGDSNKRDQFSDSSSSANNSMNLKQQRQKEALQKLASTFKKKTSEIKKPDSWHVLIQNLLNSQRGKLPLLLAVEAGNQSMVRELLSAQTAEQLKVSELEVVKAVYTCCQRNLIECAIFVASTSTLTDYISQTFPLTLKFVKKFWSKLSCLRSHMCFVLSHIHRQDMCVRNCEKK